MWVSSCLCSLGMRSLPTIRLWGGEPSSTQVSKEHNTGLVGNHEFRAGLKCDRLWRHPAGPKNRNLILADRHGLAVVGSIQIDDPDSLRTASVKGRSMGVRITHRDVARQLDLGLRDWAHGHHYRPMEATGRAAEKTGNVHRYQRAVFYMSHTDTRLDQAVLESQAATE